MSEIVWRDPPPSRRGTRYEVRDFVEELKQRPGVWALYPRSFAGRGSTTYAKHYPGTEWVNRQRDDGRFDMYGRWVGSEDGAA
jgi:hypothetical protein